MKNNSGEYHRSFLASSRKHILNITNHGIHQWDIIPGLTDTGGQNVFVNQFSDTLAAQGFKVTTVNRGGYPHPVTGEHRHGLHYKNEFQRICFLEDGLREFVRKEDMGGRVPALVAALQGALESEGSLVDMIISHYWDAMAVGAAYNHRLPNPVQHIWIPHSLGIIKKSNVSPDKWEHLRVDERIAEERKLIKEVDGIGATSAAIRDALAQSYDYHGPVLWLPPCIETERFFPRQVAEDDPIWDFLSQNSHLPAEEVRASRIITEISRTVPNKRKNVVIEAFSKIQERFPNTFLAITIDEAEGEHAGELKALIHNRGIEDRIAVLGSIWEILPTLYATTSIYCTPSVVEGFGMTAQEAAATKVPVVASDKVPFATEYLLGESTHEVFHPGNCVNPLQVGAGAIIVPADDIEGFAYAISTLLGDQNLRQEMGEEAYRLTIPTFTWNRVVRAFMAEAGVEST
jgi:glycosyltransferase involved in cell wall biosynthesis